MNAERVLPRNLEAERSVLGAILAHGDAFNVAAEHVTAADFFRPEHGRIFDAMLLLNSRGEQIDFVTLKEQLGDDIDKVGGPAFIASLADGVPRSTNVEAYARIVKDKSTRRVVIHAANKVLTSAYEDDLSTDEVIEQGERDILQVGQRSVGADFVLSGGPGGWVGEAYQNFQRIASDPRHVTGVPTGFADLDRLTRGFQPGDLVIVAARPSMGKTSFVLNIATHAAQFGTVGVFSLEMSRLSLSARAFAQTGRVDSMRLMTGLARADEQRRLANAMALLAERRIAIDDSAQVTLPQIRMKSRRLQRQHGLDLLCVDYLQIVPTADGKRRPENRNLELGEMTRSLKALSKELNVPVVVLSQLSRDIERRPDKTPRLSDLRDSGAIEQDADLVLMLWRPECYAGESPKPEDVGRAELIVAKQRNGPTGIVTLRWTPEFTRFDNWSSAA